MDGKQPWHEDHAEISSPRSPKRQNTFHDDLGNGVHESRNGSPTPHDYYTIAWICALHIEMAAARATLDEVHEDLPKHRNDTNTYTLGNIEHHNIVIACLPTAQYGTNNAAIVLTHLVRTFPSIRAGLMVGIGGGVPSKADIRLGDVVVGTRVMQYDLGKIVGDGQLQTTSIWKTPQQLLCTAVTALRSTHELEPSRVPSILREKFGGHSEYGRPSSPDCLFFSTHDHVSPTPGCDGCDHSKLVPRSRRRTDEPLIHYGAIASGNQVMRSGTQRDNIARQLDVICFEMEAAGLMDILPCLPIRGICDYSDSHKNKAWQKYAAAAAAAYARELLAVLPVTESRAKAAYVSNPHCESHEIPAPTVEHDIQTFLQHEHGTIRDNFNLCVKEERKLPPDWPGDSNWKRLVMMAKPLFIFASTVCRFIGDWRFGNPNKQLQKVLSHMRESHASKLDMTYSPALKQQLTDKSRLERQEIIEEFRLIVGAIVSLASPLSTRALALMLDVPVDTVAERLRKLHSVLSVPSTHDSPVRLLHLSFRDYIIDLENKETNEFWVDEELAHRNLAKQCLRIMRGGLSENICSLRIPGTRRSTINPQQIDACLSSELQYACLYWVHHRAAVDARPDDTKKVHDFLTKHFLHWLETMSLMGRAMESHGMLKSLRDWLKHGQDPSLSSFVTDAVRFVQMNLLVIDEAPLQIYSSALVFAPTNSVVRRTFECEVPKWLSRWPLIKENWGACLSTLEGHGKSVNSVVFSHDSKLVASGSDDKTVRIWNVETGKCEQALKGHLHLVNSVVFSYDSKLVASASYDKTVRIWNVETGKCEQALKDHLHSVNSVVFSHDSKLVASASYDKTVRIWNVETGKCEQVLEGYSESVSSVAFSHDSKLVVSAFNETIRIWSVETGKCEQALEGHSDWIDSVVFSHDSKLVASASYDKTVRIWSVEMGKCVQVLEDHSSQVCSAVFSYDSKLVASGSDDTTVRIWSVETGKYEQVLEGHSSLVNSVVFSHDSKLVASGSDDKIVRIWSVETGKCEQVLEGHSHWLNSVVLSHDSKLVASGSDDTTVWIWSVETGKYEQVLEGHLHSVNSVVFSHDSKLVASSSDDTTVRIWNVETGKYEQVLEGHSHLVNLAVFSYDSKLVASASFDKMVRIWSVETGKREQVLKGHSLYIRLVAFSHDSKLVASGSDDTTVRVWSVETGACDRVIRLGQITQQLYFEADDAGFVTDAGVTPLAHESISSAESPSLPSSSISELSIDDNISWISCRGKPLFWLPAECRHGTRAISGNTIVIGCQSGRVVRLTFSSSNLQHLVK